MIQRCGSWPGTDEVRPAGNKVGATSGKQRSEPAPQSVSLDGAANGFADGVGNPRWVRSGAGNSPKPEGSAAESPRAPQLGERCMVRNPLNQAASRLRPLSRRAFMTIRPARVRIRTRKPCFLCRRRLLG